MNIQIFGKNKCFDTKKAIRYFKERGIKTQFIEIDKFGVSKGEFNSIKNALGGIDNMIDDKAKDKDLVALIQYLSPESREEKLLENPKILKTPIVRNGKLATVGYDPATWDIWQ